MELAIKAGYIIFDMIIPLAVGYYCRRTKLTEEFFQKMIQFSVLAVYPILSILSFWVMKLRLELIWVLLFGVILNVIAGVTGYWWAGSRFPNDLDRGSYLLCAILSNTVTLGGLCTYILYGDVGFAYSQLIGFLQGFVTFAFCFPLAQYFQRRGAKGGMTRVSWREVVFHRNQLPVAGLIVGTLLYAWGVPRPAALGALFDPLVHLGAWTSLLPLGFSIDFSGIRRHYRDILDLIPLKFAVTPLIAYALARLVIRDEQALHSLAVLASTPTAINAVVAAKLYDLNTHLAMAAFIVTTAIFLVVVFPLQFLWLHAL